jgi:hypothetical protein
MGHFHPFSMAMLSNQRVASKPMSWFNPLGIERLSRKPSWTSLVSWIVSWTHLKTTKWKQRKSIGNGKVWQLKRNITSLIFWVCLKMMDLPPIQVKHWIFWAPYSQTKDRWSIVTIKDEHHGLSWIHYQGFQSSRIAIQVCWTLLK